jgi:HK97 gp10 family phage protein
MPADTSQVEALAQSLERSSNRVGREAAAEVRKSAKRGVEAAKANAPVASGELRDSIGILSTRGNGNAGSFSMSFGSELYYAAFVNDGTSKMAPRPYAEPALAEVEGGFVKAMEDLGFKALDL